MKLHGKGDDPQASVTTLGKPLFVDHVDIYFDTRGEGGGFYYLVSNGQKVAKSKSAVALVVWLKELFLEPPT